MKVIDHLSTNASNAPQRSYIWGALTGLGLGLAAASKLSAASLLPMVVLSPGVPLCLRKLPRAPFLPERTLVRLLIILLAVAIVVFVLLNPTLWQNPLQATGVLVSHRLWEAARQQAGFPEEALTTFLARVRATVNQVFNPASLVAFLLGFSLMAWREFEQWRGQKTTGQTVLLLWVAGTLGFTMVFTPMNWDRYFTPLIPCKAVVLGYLASAAISALRKVLPFKL